VLEDILAKFPPGYHLTIEDFDEDTYCLGIQSSLDKKVSRYLWLFPKGTIIIDLETEMGD